MSVPFAAHILTATAACCALPNGAGSYENDLTGSGAVVIDERFNGAAQVIVFLPDLGREPLARTLDKQDRQVTLYIQGKVGAAASYEARLRSALSLANDCARAIGTNFMAQLDIALANASNNIYRRELSFSSQSGLSEGNLGAFVLVFTVTYRVANDTGF